MSSVQQAAISSTRPKRSRDNDFSFGVKLSAFLHTSIILLLFLKMVVFPDKPIPYTSVLKVDLVALPDQLKNEHFGGKPVISPDLAEALKEAETEAKKVKSVEPKVPVEPLDPGEIALKNKPSTEKVNKKDAGKSKPKDREKKLQSALARIRSLEKIDTQTQKISETQGTFTGPIKGNQLSKGTSLSGDAKEAAEASYYDLVRDRLQNNWTLPVWIARQQLSAQVQIYIDGAGKVTRLRMIRGSGNAQFDEAVKRTVNESQPMPRPPGELASSLASNGILVGFPL